MKFGRLSVWLCVFAAVGAGFALFHTSQSVQQKEEKLRALRRAVISEHKTMRVLRAEWDYLNRPARLEELARNYLHYDLPMTTHFINDPRNLPELAIPAVPPRKPRVEMRRAVFAPAPSVRKKERRSQLVSDAAPRETAGDFKNLLNRLSERDAP